MPSRVSARAARAVGLESERWLAPALVLASVTLGAALQTSDGTLSPKALALTVAAFALLLSAAVLPRSRRLAAFDTDGVPLLAAAGVTAHFWALYTSQPINVLGVRGAGLSTGLSTFHVGLAVLNLAAGVALLSRRFAFTVAATAALVAVHFALGVWIIQHNPAPPIDVHIFQRDAVAALRSGTNPYAITFPNIYSHTNYYGPGVVVDGRLQFGFPYFPLSLLVAMPGQVLAGDTRWAQLVAMELAAVLMVFARRGAWGLLAAALYLTTPRLFYVLALSWTEPFVVLGTAAVVFAACRRPRAVPWLFGALVALKQYLVFALPLTVLLVGTPFNRRRLLTLLTKAALVGAAVTLPFVLWNPAAFWNSVVALQFHQPFRPDALSVLAWWASKGHEQPSAAIAFVMAGLVSGLAVWRLPRSAAGFSAAVALTFFAFFLFNKQAFCNYYFFVIGAMCVSLAAYGEPVVTPGPTPDTD